MFIQKLRLQNYRCFSDVTFSFEKKIVLIEGANGCGKTSILEALHYGCFLKSFRTNRTQDLITFEQGHFFLQVDFKGKEEDCNSIRIGVSLEEQTPKRLIRFNQKMIKSYQDLINHFRIVSLVENDLQLVQGAPEIRRYFLNQLLVLLKTGFIETLKKYRQVCNNRNAILLKQPVLSAKMLAANAEFAIWTQQLWALSKLIQKNRMQQLQQLETIINGLLKEAFPTTHFTISLKYHIKNHITEDSFEIFWGKYKEKHLEREWRMQRGLFGAHLDDFSIIFQNQTTHNAKEVKARYFASRGQQKLVLFLIKVALAQKLENQNIQVVLLLDDFLTDFDHQHLTDCLSLLSRLSCQVFITCPLHTLISNHYSQNNNHLQIISM